MDSGTQIPHRFDRADELERSIKCLSRALEMHDGSVVATRSALWEVESVLRRLPEVKVSLRRRLEAIDRNPLGDVGTRIPQPPRGRPLDPDWSPALAVFAVIWFALVIGGAYFFWSAVA